MKEPKCQDCQYFLQHYILGKRKFYRIHAGHCTLSSRRKIHPTKPACSDFAPGTPDTDRFVNKEYLSKELLRYALDMELLPEIEDISAVTE